MKDKYYRTSRACIACVVVLLACCQSGCISSFDVTSDIQGWPKTEEQSSQYFAGACKAVQQTKQGAFMVSVGDIVPPDRVYDEIKTVFGPDYRWYPVIGNHNIENPEGMQWIRNYVKQNLYNIINPGPKGSEETTYSFNYKNAHIIVLNEYYDGKSDTGTSGDVCDSLYEWIENDLKTNNRPFIFVFGHEPFISIPDIDNGRHRHNKGDNLDEYPQNSHRFAKLLRQHHITAYINGHTHNFSYAKINGIWQITVGHTMGDADQNASSTFLKVKLSMFKCWVEVYRFNKEQDAYQLNYTFELK